MNKKPRNIKDILPIKQEYNLAEVTKEHLSTKSKDELIEMINRLSSQNRWIFDGMKAVKKRTKVERVRHLLQVPDELRIAQHIYNQFRDYENKLTDKQGGFVVGIDIFYVSDEEFCKRFN